MIAAMDKMKYWGAYLGVALATGLLALPLGRVRRTP